MRGQLGAFVGEFVQIDVFRNVPKLKIKTCVRQSAECIAKHGSKSPGRPLQRPQQNQAVATINRRALSVVVTPSVTLTHSVKFFKSQFGPDTPIME
jgi:hypothetical protein